MANKQITRTRTQTSTFGTDLGSVVRLNSNKFNSLSFSFVLDKTLQLEETPIANPIVHSLSSPLFPDTFQVFHYNLVSIKVGNNVFTDVVINPSHITCFSSAYLLEKTFGGNSAFALEFTTQELELPFCLFDFCRTKKPIIACDCKFVYPEVNTENKLRSVVYSIDLFRECEQEESSALFINSQETFSWTAPTNKIFFVTIRNSDCSFLSAGQCFIDELVSFESCTSWEIVSDTCSFDDRFGFGFFNISARLAYTGNCQLRWQFEPQSKVFIDDIMQFDVIPYFMFPSSINAELQCFSIGRKSINYLRSSRNFDFSCYNTSHNTEEDVGIFKSFGNEETGFFPRINSEVSALRFYDDFDDDSEPDFDYNDPDETNKRYDRRFPALYTL